MMISLISLYLSVLLVGILAQPSTTSFQILSTMAELTTEHSSGHSPVTEGIQRIQEDTKTEATSMEMFNGVQRGRFAIGEFRKNRRLMKVAVTKVVRGLTGLPPYYCLAYCLKEGDNCTAFNLHRSDGICEILSVHVCNQSGLNLEFSHGFDYFDVYRTPSEEMEGPMRNSLYCTRKGYCRPECESWAHMPSLNEGCTESFQCEIRSGENAICRAPPGLCKCRNGFYISQNDDNSSSCVKLDAEGFRIFPNLKSKGKQGLYFKLVLLNMNFEQASNHCIEAEGGYLAMAEDGETNRFLREYMRKYKVRSAYLGLSDQAQEGNWVWMHTGQKLRSAQFWKSGAPDNFLDIEHCATITNEIDFGWDDVPCDKTAKFFCQRSETN